MKAKKTYYHVIERGSYDNIGYHGYYDTLEEAQKRINELEEMFDDVFFEVFISLSKKEPPIITI